MRRGRGTECRWPLFSALAAAVAIAMLATAASAGAARGTSPGFSAHGSVGQVYATGLVSKQRVTLLNGAGHAVVSKRADGLGGVLFRRVKPATGYRVRAGGETSGPLTVISKRPAPPSTKVYNQSIDPQGYQYLRTRDGTKLAIYVHPPSDVTQVLSGVQAPALPGGSTPTLIEYSGYGYANPDGPTNGIAILANLMGFTVVDVNMRGTGCSGGAFDFFEPLQNLDGYDVIETIARQPWVAHHKVGMMGISYGGISQLFTAQLRPPHLAAISPLSVIDQTQTTLYPGGILNTGFAVEWAKERQDEAKPAGPHSGQPWAYEQIKQGDKVCKSNQALHGEAADLMKKIRKNDHYRPKIADPLSPITFVHKINVPVFMACQWTDEQTGGHCPTLAEHMTGTRRKWFTFTNGTHVDSLAPDTFNRWYDFLQLYVAKQAPITRAAAIHAAGPAIYQFAMGIPGVTMPPDPIQTKPTYQSALTAFERLPSIRILFENGAGGSSPGQPKPSFEHSFARFPIPNTNGRTWYMGPEGDLNARRVSGRHANSFNWDPNKPGLTDYTGNTATGGLWAATPDYHWKPHPQGTAVSYVTAPLRRNTSVIGAGALHLWVRSSTRNVDLQATVSEVRPDGKETFVQGGWVTGKGRKLDPRKSTPLEPVLSLRKSDFAPMPRHRFVKVTVPLYYEGHVYRAHSRIRVVISAPNGDQPIWSFSETHPKKQARVAIAMSKHKPSNLTLPVIPGMNVPVKKLPPCPGLRGEPCRPYQPTENRVAHP
ncbi:MAG: CocE/NonD family hydrolase [Solirubrobacterales bacterium]